MSEISKLRERVNGKLSELAVARATCRKERNALDDATTRLTDLQEAQVAAQSVAQEIQEQAHRKIADVVSQSLEAVFDEAYTFRILFEQKRGKTEARLVFERDGMEVDPMSAAGGGVVDIAALALRLSCMLLSRPPVRKLLVLDEPMKYLSKQYRPKARQLIKSLSKELNCQFLIVTHDPALVMGTVIELDKP